MRRNLVGVSVMLAVALAAGMGCQRQAPSTRPSGLAGQEGASPFSLRSEATYVGSVRCGQCHDRIFSTWSGTLHAQIMQDVRVNPRAIKGDFVSRSATRTFDTTGIILTHGIQWKQRYIDDKWRVLPAQWNFDSRKWAPYNVDAWEKSDWRRQCADCHTVGFSTETVQWVELGIGCEECHGPGSAHSEAPGAENIINPARLPHTLAGDVCGGCHTRGKSPDGKWDFPVDFRPGDALGPQNFTPVSYDTTKSWWPDGAIREHRQQHIQWRETRHFLAGVDCIACHTTHAQTTKFATRQIPNVLCRECHPDISTDPVTGHAPIAGAPEHTNCVACHMPPTGKSADFGDEHDHRFMVIEPRTTMRLGGGDVAKQPNSCNLCHYHADDTPARLQRALDVGLQQAGRR